MTDITEGKNIQPHYGMKAIVPDVRTENNSNIVSVSRHKGSPMSRASDKRLSYRQMNLRSTRRQRKGTLVIRPKRR
jgi:hypothetical protein